MNPKGTSSQHGERVITIHYWRHPRVERREALPQRPTLVESSKAVQKSVLLVNSAAGLSLLSTSLTLGLKLRAEAKA